MGVNSVTLVGRAGRDPEVRYFESGSMVANLTMAVNRRSRDDEPDWFNLESGAAGPGCCGLCEEGLLARHHRQLEAGPLTDRASGEERSKPVVRVDRLELLGSKRDNRRPPAALAARLPTRTSLSEPLPRETLAPVLSGRLTPAPMRRPNQIAPASSDTTSNTFTALETGSSQSSTLL